MKLIKCFIKYKYCSIKYTIDHREAFLMVERKLLGHNTLRGYLHDLDKVFLKIFLSPKMSQKIHRSYSKHHAKNAKTKKDLQQMIIDWECARYTKPDKPLNARETLDTYYSSMTDKVLPIIKELGL